MRNQFDPAVSYHVVIRPCKTATRNDNRNGQKTQFRAGTGGREKETGVQKKPEANRDPAFKRKKVVRLVQREGLPASRCEKYFPDLPSLTQAQILNYSNNKVDL